MACSIKINEAGVKEVLAANGKPSKLYQTLTKLTFIEDETEALLYLEAAQKYVNKGYIQDENGEPVLFFTHKGGYNIMAIPDKNVYTTSWEEVTKADKYKQGIIAGFVKEKSKDVLSNARNKPEFFIGMRKRAGITDQQIIGDFGGVRVVVDTSKNNFSTLVNINTQSNDKSLAGFTNNLINMGMLSTVKQKLKDIFKVEETETSQMQEQEFDTITFQILDMGSGSKSVIPMLNGSRKIGALRLAPVVVEGENAYMVKEAVVYDDFQEQGIGTELYMTAGEQLGTIYSDNKSQSEAAIGLWEKLVSQGFAERVDVNGSKYRLNPIKTQPIGNKQASQVMHELIKSGDIEAHCKF